jgi:hypothetical protein
VDREREREEDPVVGGQRCDQADHERGRGGEDHEQARISLSHA